MSLVKELPIGLIGINESYVWGYNGLNYYVSTISNVLITQLHLTLDEAKQLYVALSNVNLVTQSKYKNIDLIIKYGRKLNLSEDNLMFYFWDELEKLR